MSGPRSTPPTEECTVQSDSSVSRRTVLGTAGTALVTALAGCAVEASQQQASTESQQQAPTEIVNETVRVEPGQHEVVEFRLDDEQWTTVAAYLSDRSVEFKNDGPGIDVVVMSPDQYTRFRETREFDYVGGVSMPDVVNGQVSAMLNAGDYVLLVDNSATGSAKPKNSNVPAVAKLEVTTSDNRRTFTTGA